MVLEFGPHDMADVVLGDGKVIGASSGEHQVVVPHLLEPEPAEGRVYSANELWNMPGGTRVELPRLGVGVIRPAGKAVDDHDERILRFESGAEFVSQVPVVGVPLWDHIIRVTRPVVPVNTAYREV